MIRVLSIIALILYGCNNSSPPLFEVIRGKDAGIEFINKIDEFDKTLTGIILTGDFPLDFASKLNKEEIDSVFDWMLFFVYKTIKNRFRNFIQVKDFFVFSTGALDSSSIPSLRFLLSISWRAPLYLSLPAIEISIKIIRRIVKNRTITANKNK